MGRAKLATHFRFSAWLLCLSFVWNNLCLLLRFVKLLPVNYGTISLYVCYAAHLYSYLCDCCVYVCYVLCMGTSNLESRLERRNTKNFRQRHESLLSILIIFVARIPCL